MTLELTFNLDTVHRLAEHAAAAAGHGQPAGTANTGPALLLSSGANGIWLTSNGLPTLPAPAEQPGTLDRPAAFAPSARPAPRGCSGSSCCAAKPPSMWSSRCTSPPATRCSPAPTPTTPR